MLNVSWSNQTLAWVSRLLGLAYSALNAWGWWDESQARLDGGAGANHDFFYQWAVFTHLLPLFLIVLGLIFGWRQPFYGALAFILFAGLQALSVDTEFAYIALVVLPPLAIGGLFTAGWLSSRGREKD